MTEPKAVTGSVTGLTFEVDAFSRVNATDERGGRIGSQTVNALLLLEILDALRSITRLSQPSGEEIREAGDSFATLRDANIHRQKLWDSGNQISLAYRGNELAGETGEACNVVKKLERERLGIRGSRATKEQLAEELADVVICADLIAMHEGIDLLGSAVPAKFNATSEKVGLPTRLRPLSSGSNKSDDGKSERKNEQ